MEISVHTPIRPAVIPATEAKPGESKELTDVVTGAPMRPLPADGALGPDGHFPLVPVSDVPAERLSALIGFYLRNPGTMRAGPVGDALRGALDPIPGLGALARFTEPSEVGYGQAIRDQTAWQMVSGRQPNNPWWLAMNKGLVQDPLTAEQAVRTGRVNELATPAQRAWARYIELGDKVKATFGVDPSATEYVTADGAHQPLALSDAWKGASLLERAKVSLILRPQVRHALWEAHRLTLEERRGTSMKEAVELGLTAPEEMELSSGWASLINVYAALNPPVTGLQSDLAQRTILPMQHPVDGTHQPLSKRLFAKLLDVIDRRYERDILPAVEAARADASASAA